MRARILVAFAVGLLAALAVDRGFRAGFVDDQVAYPAVIYACLVAAAVARTQEQPKRPLLLNLMSHGSVGALVLVALRTILRFELPIERFTTTGHFPYFAIPVACVCGQLAWELSPVGRVSER